MLAKEVVDARWKAVIGSLLIIVTFLIGMVGYGMMRNALTPEQISGLASGLGFDLGTTFSNFEAYSFTQVFSIYGNGGLILIVIAALLGAPAIANEVSKGTIFLLLSRPISRSQILLTKYATGAVILLGMSALGGLLLLITSLISGNPMSLIGLAISVLLFWLGMLFVLGISTLFSVLFSDMLRPLILTLAVVILLTLPRILPGGGDWVLTSYWSNFPAFVGQEFPAMNLAVLILAAAVPMLAAVPLFRRQKY